MNKDASTWYNRLRRLPTAIAKGFDPFVLVADKNNYPWTARLLTQWNQDGRGFHDLKIPDTQSFYLSLMDAKKRAYGGRWGMADIYNEAVSDADKQGLRHVLDEHMYYKQAARGFQVLDEHLQDVQKQIQDTQNQLANPNNSVRANIAFQDKLKELEKMEKEIQKTVQGGAAVGGGLTPQLLNQRMQAFEQHIGIGNLMKLNAISDRIFNSRAHVLDMLESNGLITPEAHQQFLSRGKEYIPLDRIMDDLADSKFSSGVQPLDLKHQTVIKELEGSTRTPVNWREALTRADAKAFNQIERNRTMSSLVDLAKSFPDTIGKELKPVSESYRAKAGEAILGHYVDGKPQRYAVPAYLGDVMQQMPGATKTAIGAALGFFGRQWRRSVTVGTLGFQTMATFSHALSGLALSESNRADVMRYAKNWARAA
ncbi:MAG TPA: hypothetical protein VN843_12630, partial [Anaerolineales bacterium]|nr:hypothetical protein [Anaerolineales bacterium]